MIVVSGKLELRPGRREEFLAKSVEAVAKARVATGCRDFVVAADPPEPNRVNVYEEWDSEAALLAFRGAGPGVDLGAMIASAQVRRHSIAKSGPA